MDPQQRALLNAEFDRVAPTFAERTRGRFDHMDVVAFSRVGPGAVIAEVGSGTGNFLSLFAPVADRLIGIDLTEGMLREAQRAFPGLLLLLADGGRLPLKSRSIDLVATAQTLHHVPEPVPILKEMRRVCTEDGHVLVIDQVATESFEQAAFMNQLEAIRDPTHAVSRPPSAMRILITSTGMEIVEERIVEDQQRMSRWMGHGEFPEERFAQVTDFIEKFGHETGMDFVERDGEWTFTRRRFMALARRDPA
ncbi:MAG: class I SAM-dependent methyltransferase [Actinomycetota bacterium]|nr:class I SAM-dependent methyltransferase [Actinomycetota bacterium]